jgi:hypothetical protein
VTPPAHPCLVHRSALLDFVASRHAVAPDSAERGPATDAALEHLDRCSSCRADLEEMALAVIALRRLRAESEEVGPSPAAWSGLRDRVAAPRVPSSQVRATLGGILAGAALVATLVAPAAIWQPRPAVVSEARSVVAVTRAERAEQRIQWSRFGAPLAPAPEPILAPGEVIGIWHGPDGIGAPSTGSPDAAPAGRAR